MKLERGLILGVVLAVTTVAGCGGSNDSAGSGGVTESISGKVADGYLVGATVCLDVNGNKSCDADEPSATTVAGGAFEITGVSAADRDAYPLLVEVGASVTDEDDPGVPVGSSYVMAAPAGKSAFVSPLTTMIQGKLEANPSMSVDDAESSVKAALGYAPGDAVSLFEDYVELQGSDADPNQEDYARIHNVARVAARALQNNFETVESEAAAAGLDPAAVLDELVRITVREVIAELNNIVAQVDEAGAQFDDAAVDSIASLTVGDIDTTDLAAQVDGERLAGEAAAVDVVATLQAGLNQAAGEPAQSPSAADEFFYGRAVANTQGEVTTTGFYYDTTAANWVNAGASTEPCTWLTSNGWQTAACEGTGSITSGADNTVTLESAGEVARIAASGVDVSNQPISQFLDDVFASAIPDTAVFSSGAMAYLVTSTLTSDVYDIGYYNPLDGADCAGLGLDGLSGTTNCNVAWENGAAVTGSSDADLAKLTDGGDIHALGDTLGAKFLSGGTVEFYTADQIDGTGQSGAVNLSTAAVATGAWQITAPQAGGPEILVFEVPSTLRTRMWEQSPKMFFGVYDGYVRPGFVRAAGLVEEETVFNDAAMTQIKDSFSPAP